MSTRVLAVCLGNICRSPAAEAAIREAAELAGVPVEVSSAGTARYHIGEPPHPEIRRAGRDAGLEVGGTARQVTPADFERFDLIVAMDRSNLADLRAMAPTPDAAGRDRRFRDFADGGGDVPDPWGGPTRGYDETVDLVRQAARGLVAAIRDGSV